MKTLKVIPNDKSLLHLQKIYIAKDIQPETSLPKAVKVFISENVYYLCQLFKKNDMHEDFCKFDNSVVCYKTCDISEEMPLLLEYNIDYLSLSNIKVISKVSNIKSLSLTIVLESPELVPLWKKSISSTVIIDILKFFLLTSQSYVFLDCIEALQNFGFYCLYVNSIGNVDVGRVTSNTKVKIVKVLSRLRFEQLYQDRKSIHNFSGYQKHSLILTEIIQNAQRNLENFSKSADFHQSNQVLIVGPPGCGKTTLAKTVAKSCRVPLLTIHGPELSNTLPGETEKSLKKVFQDAKLLASEEQNGICVLLIDQVDSLCSKDSNSNESHLVRCKNQLLALLDTVDALKCMVIVGTTNRVHLLDPAIRRPGRLDHEILMGMPSQMERKAILEELCLHLHLNSDISLEVARWTPGFVAADLALLCFDVARFIHKTYNNIIRNQVQLLSCWSCCLAKIQPSSLRGQIGMVDSPKISLEDIGGVRTIKQALKQAVELPLTHSEAFARLGIPFPKGILLYGPPGCAKTSLVRAISSSTNTTFLAISAAEIYSPFVGDAERTIAQLFHKARTSAPTVLFIDEIDALVGSRGNWEQGSQERVLSAFLIEMDGVGIRVDLQTNHNQKQLLEGQISDSSSVKISKEQVNNDGVIVIAATNRPDMLDSALIRPGRFDKLLYVEPPNYDDRLDILKTLTKKMPLSNDMNLHTITGMTELYSGADLSRLCNEAGLWALTEDGMSAKEIKEKHWLQALSKMKPSLTSSQVEWYKSFVFR